RARAVREAEGGLRPEEDARLVRPEAGRAERDGLAVDGDAGVRQAHRGRGDVDDLHELVPARVAVAVAADVLARRVDEDLVQNEVAGRRRRAGQVDVPNGVGARVVQRVRVEGAQAQPTNAPGDA